MKKFLLLLLGYCSFLLSSEVNISFLTLPVEKINKIKEEKLSSHQGIVFLLEPEFFLKEGKIRVQDFQKKDFEIPFANYTQIDQKKSFLIYEKDGLKVGLFAILKEENPKFGFHFILKEFAIKHAIKEMQKENVDVIVMCSLLSVEEDRDIMNRFSKIDLIVGPHKNDFFEYVETGVIFKSSLSKENLQMIDLLIQKEIAPGNKKKIHLFPTIQGFKIF